MDCKECKERFRADKVIEDWCAQSGVELPKPVDALSQAEMKAFVDEHQIPCPSCGKHNWTDIRQFNLMFKTFQGVTEDAKNTVYLRPETAQGIFVNFQNVQRTTRRKLPFACAGGRASKRLPQATSPSAPASSSRWSWNSSASRALNWSGLNTGRTSATSGCWTWACGTRICASGTTTPRSSATTHRHHQFEFVFPFGRGEQWGVASRTNL